MWKTFKRGIGIASIRVALVFMRIYWKVFRPEKYGVKCIIQSGNDVLCIKNTYGKTGWTFPGGGVKKKETEYQAVIREVKEETGLTITNIRIAGSHTFSHESKIDHVTIFCADTENRTCTISNEIEEAR